MAVALHPSQSTSAAVNPNSASGLRALMSALQASEQESRHEFAKPLSPTPLREITGLVERLYPGRICSIMLTIGGKVRLAGGTRLPDSFARAIGDGVAIGKSGPSFASAALSRSPIVTANIQSDRRWRKFRTAAKSAGLYSCWAIAITSRSTGDVLGTVAVYGTNTDMPEAGELEVLEIASKLAALALEHGSAQERLNRQSVCDRLTGLPNRYLLDDYLKAYLELAKEQQEQAAVLSLNLSRWKEFNETLGHVLGDQLLVQVAARLTSVLETDEFIARIGGDEFAVLLTDIKDVSASRECAQRLLDALEAPFHLEGYELNVSAAVGIGLYPQNGADATSLTQSAEAAMYNAKGRGGGISFFQTGTSTTARERMDMERDLRRALQHDELKLFYQPQVDLDGTVIGMEALIRWYHPTRGFLAPGFFIPAAEESGLIVPIGAWVLREACRQCAEWHRNGTFPVKIAVNVSSLQFYYSDLVELVSTTLKETGLPAKFLEIELTESLLMRNCEESSKSLERLRELGVTVAIDDFGTGYSSLSYLQRFPVDLLKIDRSFLKDIDNGTSEAVITAITVLAHSLNLRVVAEGVETTTQMESVRKMGVDIAQGYLFGKPMSAAAVSDLYCGSC